jgi:hypothetical protein
MKTLSPDWFFTNPIDQEHKKWILLDYIKHVDDMFKSNKLYPSLSDIVYQINNLNTWSLKKEFYKGELKGMDFNKMTLLYDTPENSKEISEINKIVKYSIGIMDSTFKEGRKIWQTVERSLTWNPIGLIPLYKDEGYILIKNDSKLAIYQYNICKILKNNEDHYGTNYELIDFDNYKLNHLINIKERLIKERHLPNPLTVLVDCDVNLPFDETILPVVKILTLSKINKI